MFYHSLLSDWNNGNAHFLRGVASELISRGHDVRIYEQKNAWSLVNLVAEYGRKPIKAFHKAYPRLNSICYDIKSLDLDKALSGADMVIVHEWNDHKLVSLIGEHRAVSGDYCLLFHDTHHRAITDPASISSYDLQHYDGVLAFGNVLRDIYLSEGWAKQAWTWHEAADSRVFKPKMAAKCEGDLVWIGNWGDDERTKELHEFLLRPVKELGLKARVYGVRYPKEALAALENAGIEYGGWLPNYEVPGVFAKYRVTVHVPRRPYVEALPGIPTIRPFEALACGIPMICSPWDDAERLFTVGKDFLTARNCREMKKRLCEILDNQDLSREMSLHGYRTLLSRHTCAHRVEQLMDIYREVRIGKSSESFIKVVEGDLL